MVQRIVTTYRRKQFRHTKHFAREERVQRGQSYTNVRRYIRPLYCVTFLEKVNVLSLTVDFICSETRRSTKLEHERLREEPWVKHYRSRPTNLRKIFLLAYTLVVCKVETRRTVSRTHKRVATNAMSVDVENALAGTLLSKNDGVIAFSRKPCVPSVRSFCTIDIFLSIFTISRRAIAQSTSFVKKLLIVSRRHGRGFRAGTVVG